MGIDPEKQLAEAAGAEHDEAYETYNTKNPALDPAKRKRAQGRWAFTRRGWFWGCVIAVIAVAVVTPIAVKVQRRMKTVPLPANYQAQPYDARSLDMRAAGALASLAPPPTCAQLAGDLPPLPDKLVGGRPPPALRFEGGHLVVAGAAAGGNGNGGRVQLRGVTLDGFEAAAGRAYVALPGLALPPPELPRAGAEGRAAAVAAWASTDLLTALAALRLQGFNAVRLPFGFDGPTRPPSDSGGDSVTRACPGRPPSVAELAARASAAAAAGMARGGGKAPPVPPTPPALELPKPANGTSSSGGSSSGGDGVCNEHVPASSALARLLWVAEACVRSGLYVVLEYRPPRQQQGQGQQGQGRKFDDPAALASAWQRVGAALMCLPAWQGGDGTGGVMAGRVLLDPAGAPPIATTAAGPASWAGEDGGSGANLAAVQLSALDALARLPPAGAAAANSKKQPGAGAGASDCKRDNGLLFALQGVSLADSTGRSPDAAAPRGKTSSSSSSGSGGGDPQAALPPLLEALLARPYAGRVLLAPRLAGPAASGGSGGRAPVSARFAAEWAKLRSDTFCSNATSLSGGGGGGSDAGSKPACVRFPLAAGELAASLGGGDDAWANSTAALLAGQGGGGGRKLESADGWWWAPYAGEDGVVSADRAAAPQWRQLRWLRGRAGLQALVP